MDIRYVAGIIDGEGTITLTRPYVKAMFRRPVISVPSTTIELIDALKKEFGGGKTFKKAYKEAHSDAWVWILKDHQAVMLLKRLAKHLIVPEKIHRATLIVTEYDKLTRRNGKYSAEEAWAKIAFEKRFFKQ